MKKIREYREQIIRITKIAFWIIYIGMVIILTREMQGIELKKVNDYLDYWIMVGYLYAYIVFYFGARYGLRVLQNKKEEKQRYYRTQFPNVRYEKSLKSNVISVVKLYVAIFSIFVIVMMIKIREQLFSIFVDVHISIWEEKVEIVLAVIFGVYAIIMTLISLVDSDLNRKCLFFNAFEIPSVKSYKINTGISIVLLVVEVVIYFIFGKNVEWLYGILESIWILIMIINTIQVITIYLLPTDVERRMLKKIDKLFGRKKNYMLPNKTWYVGATIKVFERFIKSFWNVAKSIDVKVFDDISFGCVLDDCDENKKLAKRFYGMLIGLLLFLECYNFVLSCICGQFLKEYMIVATIGLLPIGMLLFNKNIIERNYNVINRIGYISWWGYYITPMKSKKTIYISSYDYSFSKYRKYIIRLKKLMCFYNLAIKMKYENEDSFDYIGVDCLCDYAMDEKIDKKNINGLIVPMLIATCLCDEDGNKIPKIEERIKKLLCQLDLEDSEKRSIIKLSLVIIRDMTANDDDYDSKEYDKKLLKLLSEK